MVLDRPMPRMSGEQVLLELRRRNIDLPVIILTGHGGSSAETAGVDAIMLKPVAAGELVHTVRAVLDKRRVAALS
ncbi:MAG: Response regulator receiver domain [Pseudomonadota bacterium]|jgi:two-component system C4-dicarboxylate transport response regulator DctD